MHKSNLLPIKNSPLSLFHVSILLNPALSYIDNNHLPCSQPCPLTHVIINGNPKPVNYIQEHTHAQYVIIGTRFIPFKVSHIKT